MIIWFVLKTFALSGLVSLVYVVAAIAVGHITYRLRLIHNDDLFFWIAFGLAIPPAAAFSLAVASGVTQSLAADPSRYVWLWSVVGWMVSVPNGLLREWKEPHVYLAVVGRWVCVITYVVGRLNPSLVPASLETVGHWLAVV